jgi:uncharacterized protein (TIGR03118 family)
VNAWGLVAGPVTPWWVANNETSTSTLYDGTGNVLSLVVQVAGSPSGTVFNGGSDFPVSDGTHSAPALFLFATESGTILGWNASVPPPSPSTQTFVVADRSAVGAIYKGLALASTPSGDRLFAADFHNRRVDVFDVALGLVTDPTAFVDRKIPKRFAPFGIQAINGTLFVTYAKQDKNREDDVDGNGFGYVDAFDTSGKLLGHVAAKGPLNAPWGLAFAPSDFGGFSGDLLVGNFGNGRINAYQQKANGRWKFRGPLRGSNGKPLKIDGLWALQFGNGGAAGPTNSLYFTAGPDDERHGLFGKIEASG